MAALCLALATSCQGNTDDSGGVKDGGATDAGGTDAGGMDGGAMDGGEGPMAYDSVEAFAQDVSQALCDLETRCGQFSDSAHCTSSVEDLFRAEGEHAMNVVELRRAIDDGRLQFDGAAARECVEQLQGATCGVVIPPSEGPCLDALAGQVAEGQACFATGECGPDDYCAVVPDTCPGVCAPRKGEGEAAQSPEQCMRGMFINGDGNCTLRVPVGDPCPSTAGGDFGFGWRPECTRDAYCDETSDICRLRGDLGADCVYSTQCMSMYTCTDGKCAQRTPTGGACDLNSGSSCQQDLRCTASDSDPGTCEAREAVGGECLSDSDCSAGLQCLGVDTSTWPFGPGACSEKLALGEACDFHSPFSCVSSAYCSSDTNTCQAKVAVGDDCTSSTFCEDGAACGQDGKCMYVVCEDRVP